MNLAHGQVGNFFNMLMSYGRQFISLKRSDEPRQRMPGHVRNVISLAESQLRIQAPDCHLGLCQESFLLEDLTSLLPFFVTGDGVGISMVGQTASEKGRDLRSMVSEEPHTRSL